MLFMIAHLRIASPYQIRYVDTLFRSDTHHHVRSPSKTLILLHGGGGNSTMWLYKWLPSFSDFCVYAIDIIGEAGKCRH